MQSGFRAGHGCTSATLKVLNNILTAIDKKQYCAAVFIDLAKAFDSVNYHILVDRLDSLGFPNDCLAWLTNYFSDRVGPSLDTVLTTLQTSFNAIQLTFRGLQLLKYK